jgi:hypothetical protein
MIKVEVSPLAAKLSLLAANIRLNANKRKQSVAANLTADLVSATPVKTGLAQSNWQVTSGAPAEGIVEIGHRASIPDTQPGDPIYIANNVPYIQRLNDGSSKQAPAGFVEDAIARFHSSGATISIVGGPDLG